MAIIVKQVTKQTHTILSMIDQLLQETPSHMKVQNNQRQQIQRGVILQHVPLANEALQAWDMVCLLFIYTLHSSSSASCSLCDHNGSSILGQGLRNSRAENSAMHIFDHQSCKVTIFGNQLGTFHGLGQFCILKDFP